MNNSFEPSPSHDDNQILSELEFTPEAPSLEDQQLALIDLQQRLVTEWANDPNGLMVRIIDRLDADIDTSNLFTRLYPGIRYNDDTLGVRTERIVIHTHSKRLLPSLAPGNTPRMQRIDKDIPIATIKEGTWGIARYFEDTDATLIYSQIERLRQLQSLCPNLSDDLMTITPTPGKELTRLWRSDAFLSSRSQE